MAEPTTGVGDAAGNVIVLAFDLAESELAALPSQIAKALDSLSVQAAIKKTLLDFAKTRSQLGPTVISAADAQKLGESLGDGVKDAGLKELEAIIKKTSEFKALEASLTAFKQAAQSTKLGVWVDRNKKILYVVGAALALGGASVLYITRTGGTVLNTAMDPLEGKEFEILQAGKLTLKAGLWDFQPDARIFGARVLTTLKWEKVSLDLKLGVLAEELQIKQVDGAAILKLPAINLQLKGTGKPQTQEFNFALSATYKGRSAVGAFEIGVGAIYDKKQGGGAGYGGMVTLSIDL